MAAPWPWASRSRSVKMSMMSEPNVAAAGTVTIGGDLEIHRLGFGTMRLTGPGVFGPPHNIEAARAVLRALPDLGVSFISTSNAFGPVVSEFLVREVLHPYRRLVIGSMGGLLRPGPFQWRNDGRPQALRTYVDTSLKVLDLERIDLWLLHVDPELPMTEQFDAVAELQRVGLIRHLGLSEAPLEQIAAASTHFTVAAVQNLYHVIQRRSDPVLEHCERVGIPFISFFPLATGALAAPDSILTR